MNRNTEPVVAALGNFSVPRGMNSPVSPSPDGESARQSGQAPHGGGLLIVNADDWGRDHETTQRMLDCILCGAVSSVSAMVFMQDSERAAAIAQERGIDAGLHLNLTTPFSAPDTPLDLIEHQRRLSRYLRHHRLGQVIFHPGLAGSFKYVVAAQIEEFRRLYGAEPARIDGHHHAHLCANVLLGRLLPAGTIVRRNFSFRSGERSFGNRLYRKIVDRMLARRHLITDLFFSLLPLEPQRLQRIFSAARESVVELETHPVSPEEYRLLTGGEIFRLAGGLPIARGFTQPLRRSAASGDHGRASGNV